MHNGPPMRRLLVIASLLSVLATTLAWAGDMHSSTSPGHAEAVHHNQAGGDPHPPAVSGCHVFHCQASAHFGTLPVSLFVAKLETQGTPAPATPHTAVSTGVISSPWRPPTV